MKIRLPLPKIKLPFPLPQFPVAELLLIAGVFFFVIVGDVMFDILGVVLYKHPADWNSVLRVINHPLAPR